MEPNIPTWQVNGHEFILDQDDFETMKRYEAAFAKMAKEEMTLTNKVRTKSKQVKDYCDMYYHLFDNLFGKGAAYKIFEDKYNARLCDEVFESFLYHVVMNRDSGKERRKQIVEKYMFSPDD